MNLRFLLLLIFVSGFQFSMAQDGLKISYQRSFNGRVNSQAPAIVVQAFKDTVFITGERMLSGNAELPYEQSVYLPRTKAWINIAALKQYEAIAYRDLSGIGKQKIELLPETKVILGYTCKKARTIVNSNTIDLWYTTATGLHAAPSSLGIALGTVLEMVRNGNTATTAVKVEKIKPADRFSIAIPKITDELSYKDLLWKSRFKTITVFQNDSVNFAKNQKDTTGLVKRYGHGTVILRRVTFPVLTSSNQVFAELKQQSNGDAYDRTGTVFYVPEDRAETFLTGFEKDAKSLPLFSNGNGKTYQGIALTPNFLPLVELMRFYTSFGVGKYNNLKLKNRDWEEWSHFRQDVSAFNPVLSGKTVWVGIYIGNYDGGGHKVNLEFTVHGGERGERGSNKKILPLFNTVNVLENAGQDYGSLFSSDSGLTVTYTLDKDIKNAQLRYLTTGHGGWGGGDEFVPKVNTIFNDGREVFNLVPWREDCGSYRLYNPSSGNFGNGLSSSYLSRSNWCPGTVTNPYFIPLGDLKAGSHTIQLKIPQGLPEGNSFSYWSVSGVLFGDEKAAPIP